MRQHIRRCRMTAVMRDTHTMPQIETARPQCLHTRDCDQTTLLVQQVKGSGRHGVVATPEIIDFNWFAWHMQSFSVTLPLTFF